MTGLSRCLSHSCISRIASWLGTWQARPGWSLVWSDWDIYESKSRDSTCHFWQITYLRCRNRIATPFWTQGCERTYDSSGKSFRRPGWKIWARYGIAPRLDRRQIDVCFLIILVFIFYYHIHHITHFMPREIHLSFFLLSFRWRLSWLEFKQTLCARYFYI